MANTIKTKYGTVINVGGLTPEQIAQVRQVAEGKGAYGTKGAALADALRKKNSSTPKTTNPKQTTPAAADVGIDVNAGAIDENKVSENLPQLYGAEDLTGQADKTRDANYSYLTRDFAKNKDLEIQAKKQELANRGIPYSDDPSSPYGQAVAAIDQKYSDLDSQARNQSIATGNATISTLGGLAQGNYSAMLGGLLGMTDAELKKYGIDQDTMTKLKSIAAEKQIAAQKAKQSGGGSGSNVTIGGTPPGY